MTNFEAIKAAINPYTADKLLIEKEIIDEGTLSADDDYSSGNKKTVASIAINILKSFLALASDSEGGFSQSYNKEGLAALIGSLASSAGLDDIASEFSSHEPSIRDKSNLW